MGAPWADALTRVCFIFSAKTINQILPSLMLFWQKEHGSLDGKYFWQFTTGMGPAFLQQSGRLPQSRWPQDISQGQASRGHRARGAGDKQGRAVFKGLGDIALRGGAAAQQPSWHTGVRGGGRTSTRRGGGEGRRQGPLLKSTKYHEILQC